MGAEGYIKNMPQPDLFIQPSKTETFGIVVLEALHSGLPVVVSDILPLSTG